jgi:Protein of unknown function (DUF3238)
MTDLTQTMKNIGLSCISSLIYILINSLSAQALDFNFSFEGEEPNSGIVTGVIKGLKDNSLSFPTKVIVNENSSGVPVGTVLSTFRAKGGFQVKNGRIVGVGGDIFAYVSPRISYVLGFFSEMSELSTLTKEGSIIKRNIVRNTKGFNGVKYTLAATSSPITIAKPDSFEVRLRIFIPSPALALTIGNLVLANKPSCAVNNGFCMFGGDNRRFSYDAPSHRYIANAIVTTKAKDNSSIITRNFRDYCPTTRYLPSQSLSVTGKPAWWLGLKPRSKPVEAKKLGLDSDTNSINAAFIPGTNDTVKVLFKVSGSNPLISGAPPFNADINVFIKNQLGEKPLVKVEGTHDGFPGYEIYVNKQLVYGYDPEIKGGTPNNLFGSSDVTILDPFTQWIPINNKYSEEKLPTCVN